jgi:hypothetical protein
VRLEVFNILGQNVGSLVNDELAAGSYVVDFDGSTYASGVYLCRLTTDTVTLTKKMILAK